MGEAGLVGELGDQQPADLGAQQVAKAASKAWEAAVDLAQQLVLEGAADLDPARPVGDQAGQFHHHGVGPGQRQAPASQQQSSDRGQVHGVGLDPRWPLLRRWAVTWAGLSSTSCQSAGSTPAEVSGR